ncbi:hypothetical protein H8D57_02540, partial [bacterium]|nr:hypothetical protein [bacterium]
MPLNNNYIIQQYKKIVIKITNIEERMDCSNLKKHCASPWLGLILIVLTAVCVYNGIYDYPFVFDDTVRIEENTEIKDLSSFYSLEQLLKPRAIVDFTFALNYKYGRLNVYGYHLINLLIHILNGFFVYILALTIFRQVATSHNLENSLTIEFRGPGITQPYVSSIPLMSLLSALIFIAHPIQTQTVTYTIQRYASMASMFYMASVLFYLKARITQQGAERRAQSYLSIEHGAKGKEQGSRLKIQGSKEKVQSEKGNVLSAFSFQLS